MSTRFIFEFFIYFTLTHAHPLLVLFVAHPNRCATAAVAQGRGAKSKSIVSDATSERAPEHRHEAVQTDSDEQLTDM